MHPTKNSAMEIGVRLFINAYCKSLGAAHSPAPAGGVLKIVASKMCFRLFDTPLMF